MYKGQRECARSRRSGRRRDRVSCGSAAVRFRHLCHVGRSGWEGLSGGQVEGLVGAEVHALGIGSLELFLAEVGAHLAEAVVAVARFKFLPRLSGWVEEGL